ncbi:MAG TPA: anaerobic carbon-monoxide dehydrogenase catalytic subunit [Anaerolineae bacterium]|nr:anaerobic carbon-monoxide dehydrogenase catalytic subunit [Anaerolineae bacterium]
MAELRTVDPAVAQMLDIAREAGIETAFDRAEKVKPCPIGSEGACCKICAMGPCRLVGKTTAGICGATLDTVVARNLARQIAAGSAAHSDHGRDMAMALLAVAEGHAPDYRVRDVGKLVEVAKHLGLPVEGRDMNDVARDVGEKALQQFGQQRGTLKYLERAPKRRQQIWKELKIEPRGVDREVVETLHRTHIGNDQDAEHILDHALRTALADGWGGSMLSTDITDILFGTPVPLTSEVNLGSLEENEVNIVIHGHEPLLSAMILMATQDPEMIEYAKSKGAEGINLTGICCTANEILMRQGVRSAGNFLSQELAIATGVVEAMVVDIQCIMQALAPVAEMFHTTLITTSRKAKIKGATHMEFEEETALKTAKEIVKAAIDNYPKRAQNKQTYIPNFTAPMVAGFSHEYLRYMQGGYYRGSFRPLNDAIASGRIRGVAGVVGCNNARTTHDYTHNHVVRELIKNDVLVVQTGCSAISVAKEGLLGPEAMNVAGPGLREVCEAIGIPPVLHLGSCVDNTRILTVATQMATEGGLGDDISDLPAVGLAPEWMSEKALSIGAYFVASGVYVIFGTKNPVSASEDVVRLISEGWEAKVGGKLEFIIDPDAMVQATLDHIDKKRAELGLAEYDPNRFGQSGDVPLEAFFAVPPEERNLYSRKAYVSGD